MQKTEELTLLPTNKSREALKNLDGWQSTEDHKMIYREFIMHDFKSAIEIVDAIAGIAQEENHHPDMHLTQFRNLRVSLTTHDVHGLSEKDFTVATKINEMALQINEPHPSKPEPKKTKKAAVAKKSRITKSKPKAIRAKKRI